jgi:hypothetical protein
MVVLLIRCQALGVVEAGPSHIENIYDDDDDDVMLMMINFTPPICSIGSCQARPVLWCPIVLACYGKGGICCSV